MLPALLLSALGVVAAPLEERFNQPGVPVDLVLTPISERANHPDPQVRAAYARDEMITNRIRFSRALDEDGYARLKRDLEFVDESERRRRRQVGPQDSSDIPVSSDANPGGQAQGGSSNNNAPAGDITLMNYNRDQGYATPVKVGTPAQQFLVVADTGSQDFVLFDESCRGCEGHPLFVDSRSSTFQPTSTPMYEAYGTGEASGIWALDRVEMGGYFVNDQPIALVQQGTVARYMGSQLSGIMGLGVPSISLQGPNGPAMKAPPPFWITTAENVWTDKQFGVFLARTNIDPSRYMLGSSLTETSEASGGVLTLGGVNRRLFTGEIKYMPANTTYWWQLPLEGFSANGKKFNARLAPTVIDTGSTAIMMPDAAVRAFHAQIPGAQEPNNDGSWVIPCDTTATASFFFGGMEYPIQTADILRGALAQDPRFCLSNVGPGPWLLGAAFMKNYYTAFRMAPEPQIGFAMLAPNVVTNGKSGSTGGPVQNNAGGGGTSISSGSSVTVGSTILALGLIASLLL
ncbi:acid protease [Cutaneotrichosporon oleaginosum]|uniref:Acid protease n=1 Tax=Cutaneotrichosporon oleaginosum TaxID=879819 RepID=A0A0J1BE69_9TREE|nr:acid protease [Cutaneotrichosporon oleaginosum]KLT46384.1 acid protease [Cutaneotrichosporon oleaginosum]TXT15246.1 hypothetical protein COLE_01439 [Cutaneotrichosporon oleaginosum]